MLRNTERNNCGWDYGRQGRGVAGSLLAGWDRNQGASSNVRRRSWTSFSPTISSASSKVMARWDSARNTFWCSQGG